MASTKFNIGYMIFLSFVAAIGGLLFGYDTAVISGTISQVTDLFQLDALQQGWYVGCALVGSIAGVMFAGMLSDRLGRKWVMIIAALLFSVSGIWNLVCSIIRLQSFNRRTYLRWHCHRSRIHRFSVIHIRSSSSQLPGKTGFSLSGSGNRRIFRRIHC